jgi:DNA-binding GntR family transcriptional regulator
MVTEQEYAKISIEEHGRIMDAIAAGDGERAKKEMYAHIMRSRDDMLTYYQ